MLHKSSNNSSHKTSQSLVGKTRNLSLVLCLGMLAGVLIWAKLRLVTDIPRSAYADPREVELIDESQDDLNDLPIKQAEDDSDDEAESSPEHITDPDYDPSPKP